MASMKEMLANAGNGPVPRQFIPKRVEAERPWEDEMQDLAPKTSGVGNSADMGRVQELLCNAVTTAHDDVGKALEKIRGEAHALVARIDDVVNAHKQMLNEKGQEIAVGLESAVQELQRTLEWVEKQAPYLRTPRMVPKTPEIVSGQAAQDTQQSG